MEGPTKVYRRHYCQKRHKSYRTLAKCIWHWAAWVDGEGEFALLAHCRALTVTLHETLEAAEKSKAIIDVGGCSGVCGRRHEIIRLVAPGEAVAGERRKR